MPGALKARTRGKGAAWLRVMQPAARSVHEPRSASEPFPLCLSASCAINILPLKSQIKNRVSCSPPRHRPFELEITFCVRGVISVLLSNLYLHYVLDLWFERVVKSRLRGEAYLVRYIDDFVLCFQYRSDALRVQKALCQRLGKFGLTLEPAKTKLVEFGRYAQRHASKRGRKRPETIYFLGFTLYCTRNRKDNFRVGLRTEKSRLRRALMRLQDQMRRMRHLSIREQTDCLNQMLRGHYAYYGIAGNIRALQRVHRAVERYWRKMLSSRSWQGQIWWKQFQQIKERFPLLRPKLYLPYSELQAIAAL
jgi:RNA-directed DNA polymerase